MTPADPNAVGTGDENRLFSLSHFHFLLKMSEREREAGSECGQSEKEKNRKIVRPRVTRMATALFHSSNSVGVLDGRVILNLEEEERRRRRRRDQFITAQLEANKEWKKNWCHFSLFCCSQKQSRLEEEDRFDFVTVFLFSAHFWG